MSSEFEKDFRLVEDFGKEKVGRILFKNYISGDEDYFEIIKYLLASMLPWKKNYNSNQIKEKLTFLYRRYQSFLRKREQQEPIIKGSVFFFPISESTTIFMEPILRKLGESEKVRVLRFDYSLNGLKTELEKRNLPYVNYEKYLDSRVIKRSRQIRKKYQDALNICYKIIESKKKYGCMRPSLKYFFGLRNRFYEVIEFCETFKNFISIEKPSMMVLSGEGMDVFRAASVICNKNNVPCIFFQDGNVQKNTPEAGKTFATKKIVFGETAKKQMIQKGMPAEKIVVTGSPLYDVIAKSKINNLEKESIKESLGIKNKKVILFASTTNMTVAEKRLKILYDIARKDKSIHIIIKQHPGEYKNKEYEDFYHKLASKYGVNVIVSKDDMYKMLRISDVYVTDFSTTILEALLLKVPMILTDFETLYDYSSYPEFKGLVWHAYNSSDVNKAVGYILKNKYSDKQENFRKKLIKKNLYKDDGHATGRVVNLIKKLRLRG